MSKQNKRIETPLARARGLGSAHHGVQHWMAQRVTALLNVPLMIWLVWSVTHMGDWSYMAVNAWLAAPVNAVLMILAICSVFYHAALGAQVVAEDYISCTWMRIAKVIGIKVFFLVSGLVCVFTVLKVALG